MDPNCRGVFFGLSAIHSKAHMLRALMEEVGYSLADCHNILQATGTKVTSLRACGGGSCSDVWMQIIADLLACDITTLQQDEGSAYGVALLAGDQYGMAVDVPKNMQYTTYTIQEGDSFWLIAHKLGCTMSELERLNNKGRFDIIYPGNLLRVPE